MFNVIWVHAFTFDDTQGSKIEKVPRGIRGEKSSKDMASSRNLVSTIGALASPKMGDGTSEITLTHPFQDNTIHGNTSLSFNSMSSLVTSYFQYIQ